MNTDFIVVEFDFVRNPHTLELGVNPSSITMFWDGRRIKLNPSKPTERSAIELLVNYLEARVDRLADERKGSTYSDYFNVRISDKELLIQLRGLLLL